MAGILSVGIPHFLKVLLFRAIALQFLQFRENSASAHLCLGLLTFISLQMLGNGSGGGNGSLYLYGLLSSILMEQEEEEGLQPLAGYPEMASPPHHIPEFQHQG